MKSNSARTTQLSAWISYVLLYAYYSGAMTMFFASPSALPFQTVRQGLALYPDWKMVMNRESVILIQPLADAGDAQFKQQWDRLQRSQALFDELMIDRRELGEKLLQPGNRMDS